MKTSEYIEIDFVIRKLKQKFKVNKKMDEFEVLRDWENVVGKDISENTCPLYIVKERLHIAATGSSWCQEVSFLKSTILKRINEKFGKEIVKDIICRVGKTDEITQ
ncbi:MAG: DUF721 domain-containing protein [bacterium]